MKKLILPLLLLTCSMQSAFAQTAAPAAAKDSTLQRLPPPPPILDRALQKELSDTRKVPKEQRAAIAEKQKQIDRAITPLTPEQILHTQKNAQNDERLRNSAVNGTPRPMIDRDIPWSVGLGAQKIHLGPGYTTTLLFFDAQGRPIPIAEAGSLVGDKEAIEASSMVNAVVLYVKIPWRSTNLTVFLENVPIPIQFSLTSDRKSGASLDGQVRVRIVDSSAVNTLERGDMQNVNALLQLTNGAPGTSNLAVLPVLSVEKGDPARLNWTPIVNSLVQFRVGPDGLTYVLLKPGYKLLYPNVPNVLSSLRGADGTEGYIVGGNNPRVFTAQDQNGALYRITVQR